MDRVCGEALIRFSQTMIGFPVSKKSVWQTGPPSKVSWKYEDVKKVLLSEALSQDPAHRSVQRWLALPGQDCDFPQ